jgi:hypothetical protein
MTAVDLFNTERCPVGFRCEACGDATDSLVAATAETPLGVLCLTLCQRCGDADMAPPVAVGTAVRLVAQHCQHLGCDLDEMAAALAEMRMGGDA